MKKFGQILALVLTLAFGYGLGQNVQDLLATDYPGGGGGTHPVNLASDVTGELPHGSTSDDAANVHGLPASVNVLGNRTASGEFIQRLNTDDLTTSGGVTFFNISGTITFAVAFSANPIVIPGGTETNTSHFAGAKSVSTTTFDLQTYGTADTTAHNNIGWVALGT